MAEQSLKEQTNTIFGNTDNMSPQDYAQSYMEGLGITPIDDVNTDLTFKEAATNVGSVLPGIGTAMTVAEIEDELKKENPSYGKIVLLGGSELIGLIPGLGTAAKVGLRKVAKKVGAKKVVDALDSIPDSKDVAKKQILAGPGAKDYSNRSLYKAQQLKAEGYSPKEIEEITGRVQTGRSEDYIPNELVKNPQVPFKFEIPDKGIIIKKNDGYITLREASKQRPIRVGNLIPTHTKLFEQYPDLKNVAFYIDPKLGRGAHFDRTDGTYGSIVIGSDHPGLNKIIEEGNVNNAEFRRVFFHELQHAAQARDFHYTALRQLGGGSKTYIKAVSGRDPLGKDFTKAAIAKNPKLAELRDKMIKLFKEDTRGLDATSKVSYDPDAGMQMVQNIYKNPKTAKKMAELMKELNHESYKTYLQTASEVEAAVVGARAKPTFGKDQPLVSSEVSKRKNVETYDDYARGYSDSKVKKLLKRMTTRKTDLTEKEIGDLAEKGINFVRYALEIDDELVGFAEGGMAKEKEFEINSYEVDGKEMLAIDFKDGKRIFENQIYQMFDINKTGPMPAGTSITDDLIINFLKENNPTRDEFIKHFTTKRVAEGGIIMKDQMQMAFMQEGGLRDDGMDRDPVSGNEIPPGSMASEVRDDIPAQLSEGEYVVPADVVQYFGVKFFEDLRIEAKRGLAEMESNGRIGGEPMDDTPTVAVSTGGYIDGDLPSDYNVGGMTSNLYNNPTQMDQEVNNIISTMYNNPQVMNELSRRGIQLNRTQAPMNPQQMNQANPPAEARMGFNPGGLTDNQAANYNYITSPTIPGQMYQTPGASYTFASPPQLTTTSAGAGSNMPSVEYCNSIDMDYDPSTKMCVPRASAQTPQQGGGSDDDGPEPPKPEPWYNNVNWEDPKAQMDSFFGKEGRIGSAIAGVAGSMIGGPVVGGALTFGAQVSNLAQSRAMVNIYRAMGMDETALMIEQQAGMEGTIVKGNKALGIADQTINKIFGSDGDMLTISAMRDAGINVPRGLRDDELDKYLADLTENDRRLLRKRYAPNYKDPVVTPTKEDKTPTTKTPAETAASLRKRQSEADSPSQMRAFQKAADIAQKAADTGKSIAEVGREIAPSDEKKDPDYGDPRRGMMAKGGLMSKKKKKK